MKGGRRGRALVVAAVAAAVTIVATATAMGQSSGTDAAGVVFSSDGRLFTVDATGANRQQLTGPREPGRFWRDAEPAWSPDGSQIAFVSARGNGSEIHLIGANGSAQRPLIADGRDFISGPAWRPDGGALAFARLRLTKSELVSSIVIAPLDDGPQRIVAKETARRRYVILSEPAWAPDGSRLIFTRTEIADGYFEPSLHLVGADGMDEHLFEPRASSADWSPDGTKIAFASVRDRNGSHCGHDGCSYNTEVYVIGADGQDPARLTNNEGHDQAPDWSADGTRIVFASDRNYPAYDFPEFSSELYSIAADGSCLTWLTNGTASNVDPNWLPDPAAATDPGGCGAVPREPLLEVDSSPALATEDRPVLWLGPQNANLLLTHVEASRHDVLLAYDDCGAYEPADCSPSVQVQSWSACSQFTMLGENPSALEKMHTRRGALVSYNPFGEGLIANTGAAEIRIFLDSDPFAKDVIERHLDVFDDLRPIGSDETGELSPPLLPRSKLRNARRARDAVRRLGSVDAARRELGLSAYEFRNSLRLEKINRHFGPIRPADCSR